MFVEKLQNYYQNSPTFNKKLIEWCCVLNQECNDKIFQNLYVFIEVGEKRAFESNYLGNKGGNLNLKEITDEDIEYLDNAINELDGTLLVDIVMKFMKTHKIFNIE